MLHNNERMYSVYGCVQVCIIAARMRDHGLSDLKEGVTSLTSSFTLKVIAIATMM